MSADATYPPLDVPNPVAEDVWIVDSEPQRAFGLLRLPVRMTVLRLAERLEVPLCARNTLLTAAGYASVYAERPLGDPALAIDRHWSLVAINAAASEGTS